LADRRAVPDRRGRLARFPDHPHVGRRETARRRHAGRRRRLGNGLHQTLVRREAAASAGRIGVGLHGDRGDAAVAEDAVGVVGGGVEVVRRRAGRRAERVDDRVELRPARVGARAAGERGDRRELGVRQAEPRARVEHAPDRTRALWAARRLLDAARALERRRGLHGAPEHGLGRVAAVPQGISLVEEARDTFEFTGKVESDDPWQVAGIGFETDELTDIDEGIEVGDRVKVKGRILANGTWIAAEIELLDEELRFEFVGEVSSLDPWIIGGVTLAADENTEVIGDIAIGDTARVEGRILEDGAWLAEEIKLLALNLGCIDDVAVVRLVENNQIILLDWQAIELDQAVVVTGDIQVASVVIVRFCIAEDQTVIVISISVVFQLDELPVIIIIPSGNGGDGGGSGDGQVTICHLPSGDSDKARTLTVGPGAVQGHLAHGDTLGPCGGDRDGDDDD